MIYRTLKVILKIAFFLFYKRMIVTGLEKLPTKGPLLIAVNHPNTLMDPLIVAVLTKQRVGFLGNASIFVNGLVSSIFRFFHVIPIYRKEDVGPGERPDNSAAFSATHEYLEAGGTILVFPEGTSHYELKLREIKTGTARIALSYEELHNYNGGLKITPISLDYSNSLRFRSVIAVNIGDPILVSDYKEQYLADEREAIVSATEAIRDSLAERIPHTVDKKQESFLLQAHRFYTTYCEPAKSLFVDAKASLALRSIFSQTLQDLQTQKKEIYNRLQVKLDRFYDLLEEHKLSPGFFTDDFMRKARVWSHLGFIMLFILLAPIYLVGLVANYVPFVLPGVIFRSLKIDIEYKTSVSLVGGIVLFPLFYFLEVLAFRYFISDDLLVSILFVLFLPISGFIAMYYWRNLKRFIRLVRYSAKLTAQQKAEILRLRNGILEDIGLVQKRARQPNR